MIIPISTDRPLRDTPLVNYGLIALCVLLELLGSASAPFKAWMINHLWLNGQDPHLWQFVTSQFCHAGLMHLLGNMIILWVFGNCVEDRLGHFAYACFFLAGGVIAALSHAVWGPFGLLVGASGAVSAVTGAFFVMFPRTNVRLLIFFFYIGIWSIPSMYVIAFAFGRDVLLQIAGAGGVAYLAHIGGSLFGIAVGFALLYSRLLPREPYDLVTAMVQWNRRRKFRAITQQGYEPWSNRLEPDAKVAAGSNATARTLGNALGRGSSVPDEATTRLAELRGRVSQAIAKHEMDEAVAAYRTMRDAFPGEVLSESNQLELGNHLFAQGEHELAAEVWQRLLETYPARDTHGQVRLMLGLTYVRYLNRSDDAVPVLEDAITKLADGPDRELARTMLAEARESA